MNLIVRWIDRGRAEPQLLRAGFFTLLGLIVLFDVFAPRHEPHFFGDNLRGFWAVFGFLGCIALAKFMKGIGHAWLMKPVDFYAKKDEG